MKRTWMMVLLVNLLLSACAPVTGPTPTPSATPLSIAVLAPTSTATPTATVTATPSPTPTDTATPSPTATATPTPIPTLPPEQVGGLSGVPDPRVTNPELFDLTRRDAPIPQFVNAMKNAGIGVSAEEVLSNLQFISKKGDGTPLLDKDDRPFVVAAYNLDPNPNQTGETLEGPIPLFIATQNENGEWGWRKLTPKEAKNKGINTGLTWFIDFTQSWHPDHSTYTRIFNQFDTNLIDAEMQWYIPWSPNSSLRPSENEFNFNVLDRAIKYNNMNIIVQSLISPHRSHTPEWLINYRNQFGSVDEYRNALRSLTYRHTETTLSHIKTVLGSQANDRILAIGIISELTYNPYASGPNFWREAFSIQRVDQLSQENIDWLVRNYQIAREIFPEAKLYYSDFLIEFGGEKADEVFSFLNALREHGAPIDTIAFQMHLQGRDFDTEGELNKNIALIRQQIQRYREAGFNTIVTELDINMRQVSRPNQQKNIIQATAYQRVIEALIHEGIDIISFFNPGDTQYNWLEQMNSQADPTILDESGNPKLAYYTTLRAIFLH